MNFDPNQYDAVETPLADAAPVTPGPRVSQRGQFDPLQFDVVPTAPVVLPFEAQDSPFADTLQTGLSLLPKENKTEMETRLSAGDFKSALVRNEGLKPDQAARVLDIMRKRNVPQDTAAALQPDVEADEEVRRVAEVYGALAADGKSPKYPGIMQALNEPIKMLEARDDLKALAQLEELIRGENQKDEGPVGQGLRMTASGALQLATGVLKMPVFVAEQVTANVLDAKVRQTATDIVIKRMQDEGLDVVPGTLKSFQDAQARPDWQAEYEKAKLLTRPDPEMQDLYGLIPFLEKWNEQVKAIPTESPASHLVRGDVAGAAKSIVPYTYETLTPTLSAIIPAFLAGQPELALPALVALSGGQQYGEDVKRGKTVDQTQASVALNMLAEYVFERYGTFGIIKEAGGLKDLGIKTLAKFAGHAVAKEGVSEGLTQVAQQAADYATGNPEGMDNIWANSFDAFVAGAFGGLGMSGPVAIGGRILRSARMTEADKAMAARDQVIEKASSSKLLARDPQTFGQVVSAMLEKAGAPEKVQIAADKVLALFQNDEQLYFEFADRLGVDRVSAAVALKTGGELEVNNARLLAEQAKDAKLQKLRDDLRLKPDGFTVNEIKEQTEKLRANIQELTQELQRSAPGSELPARVKAIRTALLEFTNEKGQKPFSAKDVDAKVMLLMARAKLSADMRGISIEQWFDMYGLRLDTKARVAKGPDGEYLIVEDGQATPQELFKKDAEGQRAFMVAKAAEAGLPSVNEATPEQFTEWSKEWRQNNPRFDANGKQLFQIDTPDDKPRVGLGFEDFFRRVTQGTFGKSSVPFVPREVALDAQKAVVEAMQKYLGNFDDHIFKSIPAYYEMKVRVAYALTKLGTGKVLDIAASEGSLGKVVSELTDGNVQTVSLDPNTAMQDTFNRTPQAKGATFSLQAFLNGFEFKGQKFEAHNAPGEYDVVHESMGFQFIDRNRRAQIAEAKRMLKPGGVFLTSEKVLNPRWAINEAIKDQEHKNKFFTAEDLAAKEKVVGFKDSKAGEYKQDVSEAEAVGMVDNMVSKDELEKILRSQFKYVVQFWDSGNFAGYAASDDAAALEKLVGNIGDLTSRFSVSEDGVRRAQQISTARPGGEASTASDALTPVDYKAAKAEPKFMARLADTIRRKIVTTLVKTELGVDVEVSDVAGYSQVRSQAKTPETVVEAFIEAVKSNLIWLYNQTPAEYRERARHWYVGANRLAGKMSDEFGTTMEQSAAIIAVMSPQKDWDTNVSLARRVLQILKNPEAKVTQEMVDRHMLRLEKGLDDDQEVEESARITAEAQAGASKRLGLSRAEENAIARKNLTAHIGKAVSEIGEINEASWMLRAYDELYNDRGFDIHSPEGDPVKRATKQDGGEAKAAWGSFRTIAAAIHISRVGSMDNISRWLGKAHKVRSFYNNIADPHSKLNDVTVDTHAVAAGMLEPLAGGDRAVEDALQGPASNAAGLKGLYVLHAEAYRRAAKELGLQPRELQSITWDAIRTMFKATAKDTLRPYVAKEWTAYYNRTQDLQTTRDNIKRLTGGVVKPEWDRQVSVATSEQGDALSAQAEPKLGGRGTLTGYEVSTLVSDEFDKIAKKLGTTIVPNYVGYVAKYIWADKQGGRYIQINPAELAKNYTVEEIRAVIRHELVHAAIGKVIAREGLTWSEFHENVAKFMTPAEIKALQKVYGSARTPSAIGAEFVRAFIQKTIYGQTDEGLRSSKAARYVLDFISKAQAYLRRLVSKAPKKEAIQIKKIIDDATSIMRAADSSGQATATKILYQNDPQYTAANQGLPGTANAEPQGVSSPYFPALVERQQAAEEELGQQIADALALPSLTVQEWSDRIQGARVVDPGTSSVDQVAYFDNEGYLLKLVQVKSSIDMESLHDDNSRVALNTNLPFNGKIDGALAQALLLNTFASAVDTKIEGFVDDAGVEYVIIRQPIVATAKGRMAPVTAKGMVDEMVKGKRAVKIPASSNFLSQAARDGTYIVQRPDGVFLLVSDLRWANTGRDSAGEVKTFDTVAKLLTPADMSIPVVADAITEIEKNKQSDAYFQGDGMPRGAIRIAKNDTIINLFKSANYSTFLHESAHLFVADLVDIVANGHGGEQAAKDLMVLRKFAGVKEGEALTTEHEEKLARAFEAYLREGRAPSVGLAGAFQKFKAWLTAIYRSVSILNIEINPEVRGVFDRMLAAEQDIAAANEFYDRKGALLDLLDADDKKKAALEAKRIATQKSELEKQVSTYLRAFIQAFGGKDEIAKEARATVEATPLRQAIEKAKQGGIDKPLVELALGESAAEVLALKYPSLIKEDGVHSLEALASEFGFDSARGLAEELRDAPTMSNAVKNETDAILARHEAAIREDLAKQGATPADGALHSDASLSYLIAESELLRQQETKNGRPTSASRISAEAIKAAALEYLQELSVSDATNFSRFAQAEKRLAGLVLEAAKKGDWKEANRLRDKQLLQHALVRASIDARAFRNNLEKRYSKTKTDALMKNSEAAFRPAIEMMLANYGFRPVPEDPYDLARVSELDEDGTLAALIPDWIKQGRFIQGRVVGKFTQAPYLSLTYGQLVELDNAIKMVVAYGKDAMLSLKAGEEKTLTEFVEASTAAMSELKDKKVAQKSDAVGYFAMRFADTLKAGVAMVQYIADIADNFQNLKTGNQGPLRRLYQRMIRAELDQQNLMERVLKKTAPAWKVLRDAARRIEADKGSKYFDIEGLPLPPEMAKASKGQWTAEMLIAAVLNLGNEGNTEALKNGYKFADGFELILARQFSAEELKAIQEIWDATDSLFPLLDDSHFRLYNVRLKKVAARPVLLEALDGTAVELSGGYYPLIFDHEINAQAGRFNEDDLMKNRATAVFRSSKPKDGMTISRIGSALPPHLALSVWATHISDTTRNITHAAVVRDWNRVTNNDAWRTMFSDKFGADMHRTLRDWLKYQAVPKRMATEPWMRGLDRGADWLRARSTYAILGLKLKTGLLQRTGLINSAVALGGWKWIAEGYKVVGTKGLGTSVLGTSNNDTWKAITEQSDYMRRREEIIDREIRDAVGQIEPGARTFSIGGKEFTLADLRNFAFEWIIMNDRSVVSVVWSGAYQKYVQTMAKPEMTVKQRHEAAAAFADSIIQDTQPSSLKAELSAAGRAEGWVRFFTAFMSWGFKYGNRILFNAKAYSEGAIDNKTYFKHIAQEVFAEPWVRLLIYSAMVGSAPEWWQLLMAPIENLISWIPVVRDLPRALTTKGKMFDLNKMIPAAEGLKRLDKVKKSAFDLAVGDGDFWQFAKDLGQLTTYVLGIPADNVVKDISQAYDRVTGKEKK